MSEQLFVDESGNIRESGAKPKTPARKQYDLDELRELHMHIMDMHLGENGYPKPMTNGDIAKVLGVSPTLVSQTIRSPLFQAEVRRKSFQSRKDPSEVKEFFQEHAMDLAAREIDIGLYSPNEALALQAIKDGLDRAGVEKGIVVKHIGIRDPSHYSEEELRRVIYKRLEAAEVIDGEFTEIPESTTDKG